MCFLISIRIVVLQYEKTVVTLWSTFFFEQATDFMLCMFHRFKKNQVDDPSSLH